MGNRLVHPAPRHRPRVTIRPGRVLGGRRGRHEEREATGTSSHPALDDLEHSSPQAVWLATTRIRARCGLWLRHGDHLLGPVLLLLPAVDQRVHAHT